jgi:hypothetical protein
MEMTESTGIRSGRLPDERDSDFEAGAAGSLERHSQDPAGAESPVRSNAREVSDGTPSRRAGAGRSAGLQQSGVQRRPTQQFRGAAASERPAIDDSPATATKTIQVSRR